MMKEPEAATDVFAIELRATVMGRPAYIRFPVDMTIDRSYRGQ